MKPVPPVTRTDLGLLLNPFLLESQQDEVGGAPGSSTQEGQRRQSPARRPKRPFCTPFHVDDRGRLLVAASASRCCPWKKPRPAPTSPSGSRGLRHGS